MIQQSKAMQHEEIRRWIMVFVNTSMAIVLSVAVLKVAISYEQRNLSQMTDNRPPVENPDR